MNFIDRLLGKNSPAPAAEPRVHAPRVEGRRNIPVALRANSALRRRTELGDEGKMPKRGMWVAQERADGVAVGILIDLDAGDIATVMFVDEKGHNLVQAPLPANTLRQAHYEEIPAVRRPSIEHGERLGYLRAQA